MKKIYYILLISLVSSCYSQTNISVEEIWENYQNTIAKKEVVDNIKTSYELSETRMPEGIVKDEIYIKYPDKVYNKKQFDDKFTLIFILNGEKGIVKNGEKTREMDTDELIMFKDLGLIFSERYYSSERNEIIYSGEVIENGKSYYKIKINKNPNLPEQYYYLIDKETFEFHKMLIGKNDIFKILKYKNISGVKLMKKSRSIINNDTIVNNKIDIKFNLKINDSLFDINNN